MVNMNEWGKIVALKGKYAIISVRKKEDCDICRRCRPGRGEGEMVMKARNKAGAQVGDTVEITEDEISPAAKFIVRMGIPFSDGIIGGIIGYVLARLFYQTHNITAWIVITGAVSMLISYFLSGRLLTDMNKLKANKFVVTSIIHTEG